MRIKPAFRLALYTAFAILFATGAIWLAADQLKDGPDGEMWQRTCASLLMLHGGASMATLMLLGALVPAHMHRAWRAKLNRGTGVASVALYGLLIVSAFGLYYLGSEELRPWLSNFHLVLGLAVPVVILGHVLAGRASVRGPIRVAPARVPRGRPVTLVPSEIPIEPALNEAAALSGAAAAPRRRAAG
jgi:hypothetical protein